MNFSQALELIKKGHRLQRREWNGKGMYIMQLEALIGLEPFLVMKSAAAKTVPWVASQTDLLAEDWQLFVG